MATGGEACIVRHGEDGTYTYTSLPGQERTPVRFVSWFDALRFVNWLHNGQPRGAQASTTTEDGAYALRGRDPPTVTRKPDARYWLANEDEWYKAAYYTPEQKRYFLFGYAADVLPHGRPDAEATLPYEANLCARGTSVAKQCPVMEGPGRSTPVCAYPGRSPWGLCDVVGNSIEMMETRERSADTGEMVSVLRGGHFMRGWQDNSSVGRNFISLSGGDRCYACSFRVAAPASVSLEPPPAPLLPAEEPAIP
jgi:formylglycine-generating enzyme required for sulfatase activity